jgi:hypothetical protein
LMSNSASAAGVDRVVLTRLPTVYAPALHIQADTTAALLTASV